MCGYIEQYMPITMKFDKEVYTMGPHLHAKFGPDWGERVSIQEPKLKIWFKKSRFRRFFRLPSFCWH